jgi:hypothetical protein
MNFNPEKLFDSNTFQFEHRKVLDANDFMIHQENIERTFQYLCSKKSDKFEGILPDQKEIIRLFVAYLVGTIGKPQCGIILLGSKGTGKTTLMQSFIAYYNYVYKKVIKEYHAKTLPLYYKQLGIDYFYKRPIFIDDLGKESAITTDWGQKFDTWGDLFSVRYEMKSLTFATANYKFDGQFKEIYGEIIIDRMREHFNIFELTGESLRK